MLRILFFLSRFSHFAMHSHRMGKKSWVCLLLVVVMALALWISALFYGHGVSYQGKTLQAWIHDLPAPGQTWRGISWAPMAGGTNTESQSQAIEAVRHISTNGLPYLMAEMRTTKIGAKDRAADIWASIKEKWQGMFSRASIQQRFSPQSSRNEKTQAQMRHWDAARGLHALGPLGKSAIPELTQMLTNGDSSADAAFALSGMGPEGLAALLNVLTNGVPLSQGDWPQLCIIWALGQTPEAGRQAVPELMIFLHDKDFTLRMGAAWTLGRLRTQPEVIAPALAESLGDTGFNVRSMSEQALKEYGLTSFTRASLVKYLDDPKLHIRMAATNAFRALFPDEAAKVGIAVASTNSPPPSQ